jgi:hypothetical protein
MTESIEPLWSYFAPGDTDVAVVERCTGSIQWRRIDVGDGRFGITKEIV